MHLEPYDIRPAVAVGAWGAVVAVAVVAVPVPVFVAVAVALDQASH